MVLARAAWLSNSKVFDEPDATAMLESHFERAAAGGPVSKIRRSAGIAIYTNSGGNYFFDQIADILGAGLMELDVRVSRNDEHGYDPIADMHLVVAPHEFFEVGSKAGSKLLKSGANLSMYCTEQWQTPWFARSIPHALCATTVLDISLTSAAAFRSIGVDAYFLPPGPSALYEPVPVGYQIPDLPGLEGLEGRTAGQSPSHLSDAHERSLDFVFIGSHSERRERILAQAAAALSRHRGFIHLPFPRRPYRVGSTATLSSSDVAAICRRAKILINIHQQPMNYFEWHRIVNIGIQNGCVVLTEETEAIPGLVPGEHYIEFAPETLGWRLQWLLESPEGRQSLKEIPARARAAVQSRYNMASAWQRIIELA